MKTVRTKLDEFEVDALCSLLADSMVKHNQESRLKFLVKEIDRCKHEWDLNHAKFLETLKAKLLNSIHR